MDPKIEKFVTDLYVAYPRLQDIVKSFQLCSSYNKGNAFLVTDLTEAINFDKLTEWVYQAKNTPCKSADSLTINDTSLFLIEFKSGDQTTHERKLEKLIGGVTGKINDSDDTLSKLYEQLGVGEDGRLPQRFYLVVDSKKMGIKPIITTLSSLSLIGNSNEKDRIIWEKIKPDLKKGIKKPDHYIDVDVWYSDIFSTYINAYGIKNLKCP